MRTAIRLRQHAAHKRLYAPPYDPIRADCDIQEARILDKEADRLLTPLKPLRNGVGREVIPPEGVGMPGLEYALKSPDNLSLEGTIKRTDLADKAGVFELAIETAESTKAKDSVQKMISHQLAAAHHHAMRLLGDADKQRDPMIKAKLMNTSTRLMEAFCKGALTLQKLQMGASQIVTVQHVSINGQAIIGNVGR